MAQKAPKQALLEELLKLNLSPIFGADPDPDFDDDGDDENENENENEDEETRNRNALKTKLDGVENKDTRRLIEVSHESATRKRQLRAAAARIKELEAAQQELDRKDKTELELAKSDLDKVQKRADRLEKVLGRNLLETGILKYADITFHDVETVIGALTPDEVTVDLAEGTIDGLGDALKRIAREKPFLVAETKKGKKKEEDKSTDQSSSSAGSSGSNPSGPAGGGNSKEAQRKALLEKYPALQLR